VTSEAGSSQPRRRTENASVHECWGTGRAVPRLDAPWLLISYSTDGTIPLEVLVATAARHGEVRAFCRSYKRYRTSPTRPSPRPRTVEFVLRVERRARGGGDQALAAIRSFGA
jgi:adenine-specific DNA-methyltransferase